MKTIIKELNLLDIEDIEKAISSHLGKKISISEVDCSLVHCVPCDTGMASGMYLEFTVGDEYFSSFDLFWDDDKKGHYLNEVHLGLEESWLEPEEVFNFDTSVFHSFDRYTDGSD